MGLIVIIVLEEGGLGVLPQKIFSLTALNGAFSWELNNHVIIGGLYLGSKAI